MTQNSHGSNQNVDLSILIVSWNVKELLRACLESIYSNPPGDYTFEVIVVDNASLDGSPQMVKEYFPQVKLIENDYNYGFAKATNQAYRLSTGKYLMTLNPDTLINPGTLEKMIHFLEFDPRIGAILPVEHYSTYNYKVGPVPPLRYITRLVAGKLGLSIPYFQKVIAPDEVNYVWGTGILVRREALDSEDKFYSEDFFMYGEELRFSEKIREKGFLLYVVPRIGLSHYCGKSSTRSAEISYYTWRLYIFVTSYWPYIKRISNLELLRLKLITILNLIECSLILLGIYVKGKISPSPERAVALNQWRGAIDAHWGFLVHGHDYAELINKETERILNDRAFLVRELFSHS